MRMISQGSDEKSFREAYNLIYPLLNIDSLLLQVNKSKMIYDKTQLGYLIVLKHELPIYTFSFYPRVSVNPELISNFIIALKIFSDDIFTTEGHLKTIIHDLGSIIIHMENEEVVYILLADIESAIIKYKLRKFASKTIGFVNNLEQFKKINKNNSFFLEKIQDIFIY